MFKHQIRAAAAAHHQASGCDPHDHAQRPEPDSAGPAARSTARDPIAKPLEQVLRAEGYRVDYQIGVMGTREYVLRLSSSTAHQTGE